MIDDTDPEHGDDPAERTGAEKDHGDSAPLPFAPHADDKTPWGDTDQHSDA
jgi:hypothetical protein